MVYQIVKFLFFLTINNFYRIRVRHGKNVPLENPLIIASNHTNAFLDSLATAIILKQNMYSLPRGNVFLGSSKILKWLFNEIGMIPIYRKLEGSENLKRNDETFERCFQILKDKGTIHIYPEAICIYERRLKSMKKGAARILLGAEERNGFSLGSKIIICGLIYEEAARFNTNLLFNFSQPFSIQESIAIYKENNILGINHLTNLIGEKMLPNIVHINSKELDDIVGNIEAIYKPELFYQYGFKTNNQAHGFLLSREIAKGVNYFHENDLAFLNIIGDKLASYLSRLAANGIKDHQIAGVPVIYTICMSILLLFYSPFYLWGIINHLIPLIGSKRIADNVVKRIEFRGSVLVLSGMCIVALYYPILILIAFILSNSLWVTFLYSLSLPLFGRLAMIFTKKYKQVFSDLWFLLNSGMRKNELSLLEKERQIILTDLNRMKEEFRKRHIK